MTSEQNAGFFPLRAGSICSRRRKTTTEAVERDEGRSPRFRAHSKLLPRPSNDSANVTKHCSSLPEPPKNRTCNTSSRVVESSCSAGLSRSQGGNDEWNDEAQDLHKWSCNSTHFLEAQLMGGTASSPSHKMHSRKNDTATVSSRGKLTVAPEWAKRTHPTTSESCLSSRLLLHDHDRLLSGR